MNLELKQHERFYLTKQIESQEERNQYILTMMNAGVHFGHKIKEWNPKMAPYIYQKLQGIHIIDIVQSYIYLKKACKLLFLKSFTTDYQTFLFVGTKKQSPIPNCVLSNAIRCNSLYINNKWLGGMLTNWKNTKKSVEMLRYLELYEKTKTFEKLSVKVRSLLEKKKIRLNKYFGGIKNMTDLPNTVILIGQLAEITALKECKRLNIRNITILDTDCNPELVDIFIPANDDSSSSLNLILGELQTAINIGRQKFFEQDSFNKEKFSILNYT